MTKSVHVNDWWNFQISEYWISFPSFFLSLGYIHVVDIVLTALTEHACLASRVC